MRAVLVLLAVTACAPPEDLADSSREILGAPPADTVPCDSPEYWPRSLVSSRVPVRVHYATSADRAQARLVLRYVEAAWKIEFEQLGFRAPLPDDGACGPDDRLDVFIWRGHEECFVDPVDEVASTPWADRLVYVVVDPWGPYGGEMLASTVAHELNHAGQASDDWDDLAIAYEMTANFVQKLVVPDDTDFATHFADFQSRPDWSVDRDDGYETWYSYGAALYLFYLRDRFFTDDPAFIGRTWGALRRRDHFEAALGDVGVDFLATMPEFARWRWYTGTRDDGRHFAGGDGYGEGPTARVVDAAPARIRLEPSIMVLGSSYLELRGSPSAELRVSLEASPSVRWVLQAVPGLDGSDGEIVTPGDRVRLGPDGSRTLILTALPAGTYDPRRRHDRRYVATVVLSAP